MKKQPNIEPLSSFERASKDELQALQLERLKSSLRHAYSNVPLYKNKFDEAGVHPDDLNELGDLSKFPFTVKTDLRDNYPFGMFAVSMDEVVRLHASSGTTGKPTVVGYTQNDINTWADIVARSLRAAGADHTDMVHVAYGYGLFTGAWVPTMAQKNSAAQSSPCPVARLKSRCSSFRISTQISLWLRPHICSILQMKLTARALIQAN